MRILVTGGRDWADVDTIRNALSIATLGLAWNKVTIVQGGARGADAIAASLANVLGMNVEEYPADWKQFGRAAGPIRNQQMVDTRPDLVLAFLQEGSKGTQNCIDIARRAGLKISIIKEENNGQG
jgi:hypothetical protein